MIPTIKSFSNSAAQAFILLLDFFFRLSPLICISPPYDIIILYTYTYVNAFSRYFYYLRKTAISCVLSTTLSTYCGQQIILCKRKAPFRVLNLVFSSYLVPFPLCESYGSGSDSPVLPCW